MTNQNEAAFIMQNSFGDPTKQTGTWTHGLTKREYFAAMAMMASKGSLAEITNKLPEESKLMALEIVAAISVMAADALIKELSK